MNRVPARGATVKGIDVSHYDATIDFNQVKAAGFQFCSAKCTEGATIADDRYKQNKSKAKAAGLLFGAYHFFRPGQDPAKQAAHFLAHADIQKGDMQPMFDWEVKVSPSDAQRARVFLDIVEKQIGKKMIIYGGAYGLNDLHLGKEFKENPLWVAQYFNDRKTAGGPLLPAPWTFWSFWQFNDKGSVPGIPAQDEDMDIFNGTLEQLLKFTV